MKTKILIVDLDKTVLSKLSKYLSGKNGYLIEVETNPFKAIEMIKRCNYSVIFSG